MVPVWLSNQQLGQESVLRCPPGTVPQFGPGDSARCVPSGGGAGPTPGADTTADGGAGGGIINIPGPVPVPEPPPPGALPSPFIPAPMVPGFPPPPPSNGGAGRPTAPGPTGPVDTAQVERILAQAEGAWERAEETILRGKRCGATEEEKAAAKQARQCVAAFAASAGTLSAAMDELCQAKRTGRSARLNARQVAALEAMVTCVGGTPGAAPASPEWLRTLVGVGLPAVGSILVAA